MPIKLNCWEYMNCGREPGGLMADMLGVCPVAVAMKHDGINDGRAGGRTCWMLSRGGRGLAGDNGFSCNCLNCSFYRRVLYEEAEGISFKLASTEA